MLRANVHILDDEREAMGGGFVRLVLGYVEQQAACPLAAPRQVDAEHADEPGAPGRRFQFEDRHHERLEVRRQGKACIGLAIAEQHADDLALARLGHRRIAPAELHVLEHVEAADFDRIVSLPGAAIRRPALIGAAMGGDVDQQRNLRGVGFSRGT